MSKIASLSLSSDSREDSSCSLDGDNALDGEDDLLTRGLVGRGIGLSLDSSDCSSSDLWRLERQLRSDSRSMSPLLAGIALIVKQGRIVMILLIVLSTMAPSESMAKLAGAANVVHKWLWRCRPKLLRR